MPTDAQIARIKAKTLTYLTESADISRRQVATDEMGVPLNSSWAVAHATGVACRVIDSRSRVTDAQREIGQADAMVDMYRIIFPVGTDVEQDCRVIVGDRVYHVVSVVDDRTDAVDLQVNVKRIRGNDDVS